MSYVSGFVLAVPNANKEAYREMAAKCSEAFFDYGATEFIECWGDNVPDGEVTDFRRAVNAEPDETVMFSWILWPDRETADACEAKMKDDPRLQPPADMPFDAKRMIFGGFVPIVEIRK